MLKVVREHYLRDDIPCGAEDCGSEECNELYNSELHLERANRVTLLSTDPVSKTSAFDFKHYVVIDSNVALEQIDCLEDSQGLENVIVLQTVLAEVKHRSSPIFKRLKDLLEDRGRKFHLFVNEHHKDCYVERLAGESANDRNDRAIRQAVKWYQGHLAQRSIQVVLVTDDFGNRKCAEEMGLHTVSLKKYVENFIDDSLASLLVDRLAAPASKQGRLCLNLTPFVCVLISH